jgi:glycerol kinase
VILSIDQGTTNSKAILVDEAGEVAGYGAAPVGLASPRPGWIEQDAEEIWASVLAAVAACRASAAGGSGGVPPGMGTVSDTTLVGVTISNQRESVVTWQRSTGAPLGPVIGWQDRRTASWCTTVATKDTDDQVRARTGLRIDAMFSAPKLRWLLDQLQGVPRSDVCLGTVDAWLVWRLTSGSSYACEAGNASRTLLYDVLDLNWSPELCDLFGVPVETLPPVQPSNGSFGQTRDVPGLPDGVPILAVLADSHAALYGQGCTAAGMAKATFGTGSSIMTPTETFQADRTAVPSTLAWLTDRPTYAREGNILSSGATLSWMATTLGLPGVAELTALAADVSDSDGVVLVPAFTGLGAPYWDREVRAALGGMTTSTTRGHLARAALDSVAHQICDVVEEIDEDQPIKALRADGGATASSELMQTQADLLGRPVEVADVAEVSALGAAHLGWSRLGTQIPPAAATKSFVPAMGEPERRRRRELWRRQVAHARQRSTEGQ